MSRFVQFAEFGGPEVLSILEVEPPHAAAGEVRVRVRAAGLNPVDHKIFSGFAAAAYGGTLPSGNGNDFAGVIDEVGAGVSTFAVGDEVLGGARFFAQADYVVVAADRVVSKPAAMSFEVAGGLDIAGRTAWASVRSLAPTEADTILVSAAAGGVGVLACQLVIRAGATVIGTASTENHDFLRGLGVIPVEYGDGLVDRVRAAAARPITGVLDNSGGPTIEAGIELGVPANRINTIAARAFVSEGGVTGIGGAAATLDDLEELALLIANGEIISPIDSVFPLESVAKAYERMMAGHLRGKIVLVTG